jgi:hypothetical protein
MKGLKPFLSLGLGLFVFALLTGCAGHAPANSPGALNIAEFQLTDGVLGVSYKQLLIASGGLTPYTWTITSGSLPPGLSLATDGIISGTPTSDPNLTYPHTYSFTAKVVDSQTPVAAYNTLSTTITINPVLTLTSSTLPVATIGGGYSATVTASGGLTPYAYAVAFGSLPPGLTLDPAAGTISGTPTDAGVFNFTIQVSDADQEVATAAYTITVVGRLQGSYVITFNGWDNGQPFYTVASFVADGNGNITSGVLDQNGPSGINSAVALTPGQGGNTGSIYTIPAGSNLGILTLVSSLGSYTYDIVLSNTSDSKIILADPTHAQAWGSGLVKKQSSMSFVFTGATTNYSFGFFGNDTGGNHYVGAGMFALNTSMSVTGGAEDTNDNGTYAGPALPITGGTFATPDPNTGRATFTLNTASGTADYVAYTVSATELVAMATDASAPQTLYSILQQQAAGLTGGNLTVCKVIPPATACQSAIDLNGVSTAGGSAIPQAAVGVATFDGQGNITRTDSLPGYYTDQSVGGAYSAVSYTTGTYSLDASCGGISNCGRVTVTLDGDSTPPVWYLVTAGQAFSVGTDTNAVIAGTLLPQSSSGYTIASILGSYLGGTVTPALNSITNEVDVASTPPPGGIFAINYDSNGPAGIQTSQTFSGPYAIDPTYGAAFGRFAVCSTNTAAYCTSFTYDPNNPPIEILYIAGSSSAGATGGKTGLVGLNLGQYNGTVDPNPRITIYGR